DAHHTFIEDSEVIVDYNRQQLMPGWIPRRLGGGLGGKKESGQLRFGGRERPFRAPLRPIPFDDLKRLGIPPPPEGRYMSRFQVPSAPRRKSSVEIEGQYYKHHKHSKRSSVDREDSSHKHHKRSERSSEDKEDRPNKHHKQSRNAHQPDRGSHSRHRSSDERTSVDREERAHKRHKDSKHSLHHERWSPNQDPSSNDGVLASKP
ncbi:unnamed protein product, partial [Ilex paraguariensis]